MKKIAMLASVAAIAGFMAGATPQTAFAKDWSMVAPWAGGPLLEDSAKAVAREIELLTNEDIKVEDFPGGTLGSALKVTETVESGVAQIGQNWAGYDWGVDKTGLLFGGWAGTMSHERFLHWLFQGGGAELLMDWRMEKFGVASIPCGSMPAEIFLHSHRKVTSLEDFAGMKVRTSGAWAEIAEALGASAVVLPGAEVYAALERKVVDGIEWGTPSMNTAAGYEKIAPYIVLPGIHQPSAFHECVINAEIWKGLSEREQELLKRAGQKVTFDFWMQLGHNDAPAWQEMLKSGAEVIELDDDFMAKARAAIDAWADRQAADNEWFAKVLDHQRAYEAVWAESDRYRKIDW